MVMNILGAVVSLGKAFVECVVRRFFKTSPKEQREKSASLSELSHGFSVCYTVFTVS
jgi:hypothetical protein